LPEAELIVIDEAQHVKSKSYLEIIEKWNNSLILGTTATPRRLDGKPMNDIFQRLILGPTMRELINQNYLVDYDYYAPDNISMEGAQVQAGEYKTEEMLNRVDKKAIVGSAIKHYQQYADHKPAIVSCVSILHADKVAKEFTEAGYRALAIHSGMEQEIIEKGIAGLKNGEIEILTQCELLGEGIDIPGATVLIGLRPTMSEVIFLQHIGRVLRRNGGKEKAIILDHVGNWERHGLPDDYRGWSLNGIDKKNMGELNYKRCPDCIRPVPKHARVCPFCGHEWQPGESQDRIPEQKEGELVKITGEEHIDVRVTVDWKTLIQIITNEAHSLKQAIDLAVQYGMTHRHAWYIWKNILGR
jgi:superfamily II DNA or RNA helicase